MAALRRRLRPGLPGQSELRLYRDAALRSIVRHAYENVPHYRRLFDAHGIKPRDVRTAKDLQRVPVTDREELRLAPVDEVVARGVRPDRLIVHRTSGTVGRPFNILRTRVEHHIGRLTWWRATRCYGVGLRDRLAAVVYMEHGPSESRLALQGLRQRVGLGSHLPVDLCLQPEEIARVLSDYRPDFIAGYAGTLSLVALAAEQLDLPPLRPRAVYVGGEVLTDSAREQVHRAFRCPVYNCYASEEFGLMAWECPETGELHTHDDAMIFDLVKDGRPAPPGERGDVVGTNLFAYAMPLIRYRLGDVATRGSWRQCACGAPFGTIRSIQGRVMDYLQMPDGRMIHPYDVVRTMHRVAPWILRQQIVQERLDRVVLRVVTSSEPEPAAVRALRDALEVVLGKGVTVCVTPVAEIPLLPNGKLQYCYSMVDS
jgi:phenylacetate-CoA ligase